ncbi:hypothetical protein SKAU_G00263300 [Synaphobranchus kaupii]|uniref:Uncharacterized protein n=1 Tax=Synaphobranchus kaupii TaxID=118154 RepID=A0A9Q1EZ36_SYNKA|nr:hypothetical protein SKAU_G00263300 [Synaphobranchus kaupii]
MQKFVSARLETKRRRKRARPLLPRSLMSAEGHDSDWSRSCRPPQKLRRAAAKDVTETLTHWLACAESRGGQGRPDVELRSAAAGENSGLRSAPR